MLELGFMPVVTTMGEDADDQGEEDNVEDINEDGGGGGCYGVEELIRQR